MTQKKTKRATALDLVVAVLILSSCVYVLPGFFSPDPSIGAIQRFLLWCGRVGTPVLGAGILLLYFGVRRQRISGGTIILLVAGGIVAAIVAYPILSFFISRSYTKESLELYHPYLQITPPEYRERESTSGGMPLRVFCLGGSTVEFGDNNGRDWPSRVEEHLAGTVPGRRIEVHNLGRRWYTSQHTLINYMINLRHRKPHVVLVMHAINDLLHNADFCYYSVGKFHEDYRHFLGPVTRLVKRPSTMETIGTTLRSIWYFHPREVIDTDEFPGLVPFKRKLGTLIDLARLDGTTVVLMTQPCLEKDEMTAVEKAHLLMVHHEAIGPNKKWSVGTAVRGMQQYNDAVREVAKTTGVYLIDLERVVPKSLEYFYDDVHYRDKTFDLIAEHIAKKLIELDALNHRSLQK